MCICLWRVGTTLAQKHTRGLRRPSSGVIDVAFYNINAFEEEIRTVSTCLLLDFFPASELIGVKETHHTFLCSYHLSFSFMFRFTFTQA